MDSNTLNKWLFTPGDSVAMSDSDHTSPSPAQCHLDSTPNAPLSDPNRAAEYAATKELKRFILRGSGSVEVERGSSTGEWESQKIGVPRKQAEEEEEGNRGGEEEEEELQNENEKGTQYSVRPDAEDSAYYMMRGICKFGSNCKFNHPVGKKAQIARDKANDREAAMENPGQVECKYCLSQGGCKFGRSCKFSHSRTNLVAPALELNFLGLPIRPGEKECLYFMRTGTCKYAGNCRFNHPDPTAAGGGGGHNPPPMEYSSSSRLSPQQFPAASAWSSSPGLTNESTPTQAVSSPKAEWNSHQVPLNPAPAQPYANAENHHHMFTNHQHQLAIDEYPERPGQPECTFFMKTGDCKFKSNCRFHHPKERISKWSSPHVVAFSNQGLPPKQDQNICTHYSHYGICRFGASCKFDHQVNVDLSNVSSRSRIDQQSSLGGSFPPRTGGAAWPSSVQHVIKL